MPRGELDLAIPILSKRSGRPYRRPLTGHERAQKAEVMNEMRRLGLM